MFASRPAVTSIIIAAHNEAAVIGRCLDTLIGGTAPGEFDVTVVANGCVDATAQIAAARPGVRVLDLPNAGKAAALNAGDAVAVGFPRIYLDADIVIPAAGVRALRAALASGAAAAAVPLAVTARRETRRQSQPAARPRLRRDQLPAAGLSERAVRPWCDRPVGRGAWSLRPVPGRHRRRPLPGLAVHRGRETARCTSVSARVAAPRRTRDLLRRLIRVRRGNDSMRAALPAGGSAPGRPAVRLAGRGCVMSRCAIPPSSRRPLCYVAITAHRRHPRQGSAARPVAHGAVTTPRGRTTGGPATWRRLVAKDNVLNICFHGIGTPRRDLEPGEDAYWIDADRFLRILDEIATWPSARISFDDANASDVEIAPARAGRARPERPVLPAGRAARPARQSGRWMTSAS